MDTVGRSCRGFTLIELIVVMVLLSIMTAFAVPSIRTALFTDQLKTTARKLIGLINETGQLARSKQQTYYLVFDSETDAFQILPTKGGDEDEQQQRTFSVPDGIRVVDFTSFHGGVDGEGELSLQFTKKGYVDRTLIHLSDEAGNDLTLDLSPFLGVSRLYESHLTFEDLEL